MFVTNGTISITFIFLTVLAIFLTIVPGYGSTLRHRCYVCLPLDKESSVTRDIINTFPGQIIPNCTDLRIDGTRTSEDSFIANAHPFQFDCPLDYSGCLLRSQGLQISRTCTPKKFHRCLAVNDAELCYCSHSLCNLDKKTAQTSENLRSTQAPETNRTTRQFIEGETDDEDLLPPELLVPIHNRRPHLIQHNTNRRPSPQSQPQQHYHPDEFEGSGTEPHGHEDDENEGDNEEHQLHPNVITQRPTSPSTTPTDHTPENPEKRNDLENNETTINENFISSTEENETQIIIKLPTNHANQFGNQQFPLHNSVLWFLSLTYLVNIVFINFQLNQS